MTVRPGGRIEIIAPELETGAQAEVIVLLEASPKPAASVSGLRALDALQKALQLDVGAARAWAAQTRAERQASSRPGK